MTDIAFWSAREQAAAIAAKEISSVELLELHLARVSKLNPRINAVVTLAEDKAFDRARAADEALMCGEPTGPLHGVSMTVKDAFEVEGIRTTCGSLRYTDHVPEEDADVVKRLKEAGAIIFGKTNLSTDTRDWQSFNEIFGRTNNPWDETRTPGGSSGGPAAALAAGLTALELGDDTAGSIRVPSHYCGVYGLKTTYGIVPFRGHIPGPPGSLSEYDMSVVGPIGRHADDLELGLDLLAGPTDERAVAWRLELPAPRPSSLAEYRVAVWLDDPFCSVETELVDMMQSVADALRAAGSAVVETTGPADFEEMYSVYLPLLMTQGGLIETDESYDEYVQMSIREPDAENASAHAAAKALTIRVREWHRLDEARQRIRRRWAAFFEDFDILLCPVAPTAAIPHDEGHRHWSGERRPIQVNGESRPYRDQMKWVCMAPLAYLPAAAAPIGTTRNGLPVDIQVIAPYLRDRTAVDFVQRLAKVTGGFRPPPGY